MLNNLIGLKKTVESIQNQKFTNYEVWIIDGGSKQETLDYLKQLNNPFSWVSEVDKGLYHGMNKGIDLAKGEWLYFLGVGDKLHSKTILSECSYFFENTSSEIISGKVLYKGVNKPFAYSRSKMIKNPNWGIRMWLMNGLHHQGTFYRSSLFLNNNYSLKYKILSDYWFNLRLFKNNLQCEIVDNVISICESDGISKEGNWNIYSEEISLKTELSSRFFRPIFFCVAFFKFLSRKIIDI